ncbi:hypothetical protein D9Q98_010614 [Chlorella vulgaris]|uniref:Vacuolar cation/proton exchanger n=1 Tax=Chlorella vulgaris TaxID=3077 RepID=A0A9D4TQI0_CHLVU|nr:hypothetical protein D9Q98_010614 [Chlorella vulgaris]
MHTGGGRVLQQARAIDNARRSTERSGAGGGGGSVDGTSDLEASLLGSVTPEGYLPDAAANGAEPYVLVPSRDSRTLWRLVRRNVGLSFREYPQEEQADAAGHDTQQQQGDSLRPAAYVVRSSIGAHQPAPSWQRAEAMHAHPGSMVADLFIQLLTGKGLGTGTALRCSLTPSQQPSKAPSTFAPVTDARAVGRMLTASWLNLLLICLPVGLWAGLTQGDPGLVFATNFLALIPLALFLGEVTEDLALRFGDTIGGLLNATFGNVVELFLSLAALHKGLHEVVAASLLGSILSNLLLVLGTCFLVGGMKYKEQRFSTLPNKMASSLLFLACIGIMIPSTARVVYGRHVMTKSVLLHLSRAIAIILVAIYLCYLLFQLGTHHHLFQGSPADDEEVPALSLAGALACLTAITAIVAVNSEFLTGAIHAVSVRYDINQAFLGFIVLPIAGNVAEHVTAVFVAVRNKMDLSIAIALGSSTQVAIFIVPVTVLAGWAMGSNFTLDFDVFAVLMLTVSIILAYFVCSDGASNWLLGVQLVATYCLIGFVFLLEKEHGPRGGSSNVLAAVSTG